MPVPLRLSRKHTWSRPRHCLLATRLAIVACISVAGLAWAAGPAHGLQYALGVRHHPDNAVRGSSATIKQSVNYGSDGPVGSLVVRSIYVRSDPGMGDGVEMGWWWERGVSRPEAFGAYVLSGSVHLVPNGGWPLPTIGGSESYMLRQVRISSDPPGPDQNSRRWRWVLNGGNVWTYLHPSFYKGKSVLGTERDSLSDSLYGRWWSLKFQDPWGDWFWWTDPAQYFRTDSYTQWRTVANEHDIETYLP